MLLAGVTCFLQTVGGLEKGLGCASVRKSPIILVGGGSVNTAAGPSHSFGYSYQCFNGFGQPAPFLLLQIMALVPICQSVLPHINRILNETGS